MVNHPNRNRRAKEEHSAFLPSSWYGRDQWSAAGVVAEQPTIFHGTPDQGHYQVSKIPGGWFAASFVYDGKRKPLHIGEFPKEGDAERACEAHYNETDYNA